MNGHWKAYDLNLSETILTVVHVLDYDYDVR